LSVQDRIRGCLLAGAVGDALGVPIEFMSIDQIRRRYGPAGLTDFAERRSCRVHGHLPPRSARSGSGKAEVRQHGGEDLEGGTLGAIETAPAGRPAGPAQDANLRRGGGSSIGAGLDARAGPGGRIARSAAGARGRRSGRSGAVRGLTPNQSRAAWLRRRPPRSRAAA
jgi:hypothetical protein